MRKFSIVAVLTFLILAGSVYSQSVELPKFPQPVFISVAENEDLRKNTDGTLTARIYGDWVNYYTGTGWEKINLTPRFEMGNIIIDKSPFTLKVPLYADGDFSFENDNLFDSKTSSLDTSESYGQIKRFSAYHVAAQTVSGGILYPGAFGEADLFIRPKTTGVDYLIQVNSLPSKKDLSVCFGDTYTGAKGKRNIIIRPRIAYDSSVPPKVIPVTYDKGCKTIPWSFLQDATYPVFADDSATIYDSTNDQSMYAYNASDGWPTCRAGDNATPEGTSSVSLYLQTITNGDPNYQAYRTHLQFPTGNSIPTGSTISSVTLNTYFTATQVQSFTFDVVKSRATLPLSAGDWDKVGDSGIGVGTVYASTTRTALTVAGYLVYTFTDTSIIAMGSGNNTQLALLTSRDWLNTTPTETNLDANIFTSADGASNKPYLSITYTAPATSNPILIWLF